MSSSKRTTNNVTPPLTPHHYLGPTNYPCFRRYRLLNARSSAVGQSFRTLYAAALLAAEMTLTVAARARLEER